MAYLAWNKVVIPHCADYNAKEVRAMLNELREKNPDNAGLKKRSNNSYIREWAVHALCYHWNIRRDKVETADLEFEMMTKDKILYSLTGPVAKVILAIFY